MRPIVVKNCCDIVITTYPVVSNVYQRMNSLTLDRHRYSILFDIEWRGLVADEAHSFSNSNTVLFQAMTRLDAFARWYVSGTPIQNKLSDMNTALRFIGTDPNQYELNNELSNNRDVLSNIMIRHTQAGVASQSNRNNQKSRVTPLNSTTTVAIPLSVTSSLHGLQGVMRPSTTLVTTTASHRERHVTEIKWLTFENDAERELYRMYRTHVEKYNTSPTTLTTHEYAPRKGKLTPHNIMVMIQYMRQICVSARLLSKPLLTNGDEMIRPLPPR